MGDGWDSLVTWQVHCVELLGDKLFMEFIFVVEWKYAYMLSSRRLKLR
jgi:hypothetical protein